MNIWFVSDLHFGHKNILQYSNRPFSSVEEMNEGLIKNWNDVVSPGDTIYSLGDFAMCKIEKIEHILHRLNGKHIMITGNHDEQILRNRKSLLSEGLVQEIVTEKAVYINNTLVYMHHYGARVWPKSHYGSWHLYGHSHGSLPPLGKSVDVGVDSPYVLGYPAYRPLSFYEIKEFMDKQELNIVDHHKENTNEKI